MTQLAVKHREAVLSSGSRKPSVFVKSAQFKGSQLWQKGHGKSVKGKKASSWHWCGGSGSY